MKTKAAIKVLEDAIKAATFESASFSFDRAKNQEIKEMTRLYRETWIIPGLKAVLAELKGEDSNIKIWSRR